MNGVELIAAERARQVELGYDADHDAGHSAGVFAREAALYATFVHSRLEGAAMYLVDETPAGWPTDGCPWKPSTDLVRTLVKAGALIAAEIDRLKP